MQNKYEKLINLLENKFYKNNYELSRLIVDYINNGYTNKRNIVNLNYKEFISFINEYSDLFFSVYESKKFVLDDLNAYSYSIFDGKSVNKKIMRWEAVMSDINKIFKEKYGCEWGEKKIFYKYDIPQYKQLVQIDSFKTFCELCKNRPLYINDKFVGYVKFMDELQRSVGIYETFDEDEDYVTHHIYKDYNYSFVLYDNEELHNDKNQKYNELKLIYQNIPCISFYGPTKIPVIYNAKIQNIRILENKIIIF